MAQTTMATRLGWIGAAVAVLLGLGLLVGRGTLPGLNPATGMDTSLLLAASRTWLEGKNPYSVNDVGRVWDTAGVPSEFTIRERGGQALVYPPGGWALWSPVSALPASVWLFVWVEFNTLLWVSAAVGSVLLARLSWRSPWAWVLVGVVLGLGGAHTSLRLGQTGVLIGTLIVWGEVLRSRGMGVWGGVLLGIAAAVKPQLAGLFVAYELWRGRWAVVGGAAASGAVITAIGVIRLMIAGVAWWPAWRANLGDFAVGGDADPVALGDKAYMVLSLDSPMRLVVHERAVLYAVTLCVAGALCAAMAWFDWRRRGREANAPTSASRGDLAALSLLGTVTLLATYHRYYDATVLLLPIALAVVLLAGGDPRSRWLGAITLVILAPLLVPLPAVLKQLQESHRIPGGITDLTVWKVLALGVHTWALLALACWMVVVRAQAPAGEAR